uniref:Integrase, catalytic region, zinc finger, CCHC-type, peptidase aspartic, catalytic n=1 Tax=Tanacetum cinerariifolium TaxID=118510 RepID=A0A699LFG2_TANCI|nr:hypothetical protein [Tanacetum cinerariifolium]
MNESISGNKKCQSTFEIDNIQRDINTIVTGVVLCKQKIANPTWYGHVEPIVKNMIEQNFCPVISRINVGLHMFLKRLNEEMVVDLRYFNSLEYEVDSLTSQLETQKTEFVNEIDHLSREYFYADHMNAILGVYIELDEVTNLQCDYLELLQKCECLETELSKSKIMSKSFESVQKHAINLELELQQCKEKLQDKSIAISELKKLIDKMKGKSVDTKIEKSSVIRQLNAFKSSRPSILGKPTTFSNSFIRKDFSKSTSVTKNNASNDFSKPVTALTLPTQKKSYLKNTNVLAPGMYKIHTDHTQARTSKLPQDSKKTNKRVSLKNHRKDFSKSTSVTKNNASNDFSKPVTAQTLPMNKKSCLKNTNELAPGMYKIHRDHTQARTSKLPQDSKKTNKRMSFSTGVILTTSVSRPQLKSNPQGDRVLRSNSRGKKLEVEEYHRNVKFPKNKMSVTVCNDSLNAKTVNVKSVSVMCAKCVMIDKHDLCVPKFVAKPLKKTVASESSKKPRNKVRKLHEHFG